MLEVNILKNEPKEKMKGERFCRDSMPYRLIGGVVECKNVGADIG